MKLPSEFKQILIFCVLVIFMAFSAGCAMNGNGSFSSGAQSDMEYAELDEEMDEATGELLDEPLEIVEVPELPADDGIPLGAAERIALHSTGYLDANLSPEEKRLVERHFKYYLHKQRPTFERYVQRSEEYLPYVRQIFLEKGVPEEIVFLAIVESGFNSRAVSRAGATGMWQFMRFTGQRYGLAQNAWLDERRDPYKATVAAADYLLKLYEMFEDWHLAIAAYNAGEGKISRAISHTGATSFFELCDLNHKIPTRKAQLRIETQQYVPRLLAVTKIMRNLEILGFTAPDENKSAKVAPVEIGPGTDLGSLARNSGVSWEEFKNMNPAYRRTISPPNAPSTAYVPMESTQRALAWISKAESARFAGWQQYRVRKGDSLYAISNRHGVPAEVIRQANSLKGNFLREGVVLLVPGSRPTQTAVVKKPATIAAKQKQVVAPGSGTYTVKRGDSLYSIAQAHGISVSSLQKANNMTTRQTMLMPGQKLGIPVQNASSAAPSGGGSTVVRKGDTLYGIAMRNNTSVDALLRLNGLAPGQPIMPGQEILLP